MGSTLRLRLAAPVSDDQVRGLCTGLREELSTGAVAAVVCQVEHAVADLATVDALARLALVARRAGVGFSLDSPGAELSSLLALVGLRGALARTSGGRSAREPSLESPLHHVEQAAAERLDRVGVERAQRARQQQRGEPVDG